MTLEEAIQQQVNLGLKDPLTIARKVIERSDKHWLASELSSLAEEIIAERARQRLGAFRRSAEVALRIGDHSTRADMRLAKFWVPGEGWKKAADATAEDLRKRAAFYEKFASAAMRRSSWCREVAALMDAEGAPTLAKLKAELPALPEEDVVAIEAAAV